MSFELCFNSLLNSGKGFAFPCDACGVVDLNSISEKARNNYFFAHAEIGHDYGRPFVKVVGPMPDRLAT